MKIIRKRQEEGGLLPSVVVRLSKKIESPLYYSDYGLRHPLGIFNSSVNEVVTEIEKLCDLLEKIAVTYQGDLIEVIKNHDDILGLQRNLLYSIANHLDNCENIMKCFFQAKKAFRKNREVKEYKKNIQDYSSHVGLLVNKVKHENQMIRPIWMANNTPSQEKWFSPGYYLETAKPDGSLGPNPDLHKADDTGISFYRDIRFHFAHIYIVSSYLDDFTQKIVGTIDEINYSLGKDTRLGKLAMRITNLPKYYFPNERSKSFPVIKFCKGIKGNDKLIVEYPSKKENLPKLKQCTFSIGSMGDGVTKQIKFKLPGIESLRKAKKIQ